MSAANTQPRGRPFPKGTSGNPAGRKPGTRHRVTVLAEKLMEADAKAIVETVILAAKNGDLAAARLVLDRVLPAPKDRRIAPGIDLPETSTPEGVAQAAGAILAAVATGELLPSEGAALSALIEGRRRCMESVEFERRLSDLESRGST